MVYHVLNRGNGRMRIFHKAEDFDAFERVLAEGLARYPVELFTYSLMPNHWRLVVRPKTDLALGRWMGWVNRGLNDEQLDEIRTSVNRGQPFGPELWLQRTAKRLGLNSPFAAPGDREQNHNISDVPFSWPYKVFTYGAAGNLQTHTAYFGHVTATPACLSCPPFRRSRSIGIIQGAFCSK